MNHVGSQALSSYGALFLCGPPSAVTWNMAKETFADILIGFAVTGGMEMCRYLFIAHFRLGRRCVVCLYLVQQIVLVFSTDLVPVQFVPLQVIVMQDCRYMHPRVTVQLINGI